ncbi:hypothetical protein [Streptomyces sp. NPDC006645]|uniref:hypothetical protein n=1 Tax=unclassified Streptomyces TaxID=2593676 RepID=UPI0033AE24DF
MGWTVLYIAFGVVALWLLGEVLLQYKARLRWRLLAFTGFVGVVLGVLLASVPVIAVGAIAFAVGQTYVTLSFRRGFSTGWAIGGSPGASRRRRAGGGEAGTREPSLEVSDLEYQPVSAGPEGPEGPAGSAGPVPDEPPYAASVYEPEPMPDETGQYGVYSDAAYQATQYGNYDPYAGYAATSGQDGYAATDGYGAGDPYASQSQDVYGGQQDAYAGQNGQSGSYDYGTDQQQYAAYTDPYSGATTGGESYGSYDDSYGGRQSYADPYGDPYGDPNAQTGAPGGQQAYGADTPPGGVWVPQQREGENIPPMPQQEPGQYGYDPNHDEQRYRY